VSYYPCGYAVDLLRSCYNGRARFYNGDATTDDLSWQFTLPGTPFLPVPSVINSTFWRDNTEKVDDPTHAGEVPNPRPSYSKGSRKISLSHVTYCGDSSDWSGNGTRPAPMLYDAFGDPLCCGDIGGLQLDCHGGLRAPPFITFNGLPYGNPDIFGTTTSDLPFLYLQALSDASFEYPYYFDLFYAIPNGSGTFDELTDFSICNFPGYQQQQFVPTTVNPDGDFGAAGESLSQNPIWTASGPGGPPGNGVRGIVFSDSGGLVIGWWDFTGGLPPVMNFVNPGDFLTATLKIGGGADIP
jgi:hypothetical protein